MYPEADIFTLLYDKESIPVYLRGRRIKTSWLHHIPYARHASRELFPYYPSAIESLDLSGYDLILSSDSPPMKGVKVSSDQLHICYCHTPGRFIWDLFEEFRDNLPFGTRTLFTLLAKHLRNWDYRAAQRVDCFVANSRFVASRIRRFYNRDSAVVFPPVNTPREPLPEVRKDGYLHVGRLVEYKRIDILIEACNRLQRKLTVVGIGRDARRLKAMAGPTISFLGWVADEELARVYSSAMALLFAAEEDFGIVSLEAQSYGRPVIAFKAGGALETVKGDLNDHPTGLFFDHQNADSLTDAIVRFESIEHLFKPDELRAHARQFDTTVFQDKMRCLIDKELSKKQASIAAQMAGSRLGASQLKHIVD
jgi:glycosyltransferase involved in cell wall biosynthesis